MSQLDIEREAVVSALRRDESDDAKPGQIKTAVDEQQLQKFLQSKLPGSLLRDRPPGSGATVVRDRFGVPHISAKSEDDLWCAVGFVQAQDRLWQLDYRHRLAAGNLAEAFGEDALQSDLEHRTIGLRRAAEKELAEIDDRSGAALEAYARGVNAWIDVASGNLPVEFDVLGYEPAPWSALASLTVLRHFWWSLTGRLFQVIGAERVLRESSPAIASSVLTPEASEYIVPGDSSSAGMPEGGGDDGTGSNNWVAGPTKTTTGMPALASDPHWPVHFPDLWYEQHLVAPGIDCIGAAYAGAPPVVFGRTRRAAWARTNNVTSTRDLYHEKVDPSDPGRYLDGGESRPFETDRQVVAVRDKTNHELEVRLTSRGPIVNDFISTVDPGLAGGDGPISLRWVGHEQIHDVRSLIALNCAGSASDVRAALSGWRLSVWNAIYADDRGDFGYQMSGNVPVRGRKTRGTRDATAPEDTWDGYVTTDSLPGLHSPDRGWAGSANNTPAPPSLLGELTGAYADGYRFRRIAEYLGGPDKISPEDVRDLQADNLDPRAQDLRDAVVSHLQRSGDDTAIQAARILGNWNCRFDSEQTGAAVWTSLWSRFTRSVGEAVLTPAAAELMADSVGALARELLLGGESPVPDDIDLGGLLSDAANGAIGHLEKTLGEDETGWRWERAHHVRLVHPAARTAPLAELLNRGPFPCPGGGGTVNNRRPVESDDGFVNASGVSYRLFVDFSEPGKAWGATLAGQSGQPGSLHYDVRLQETLTNQYHPLLTDPEEIAEEVEEEFIAPSFEECGSPRRQRTGEAQ